MDCKQNNIKFIMSDRAFFPTKAHPSDIGYDLTAIDIFKKISNRTTLFETGIAVSPPQGYYLEIIPRSSLSKTGYMLANSVGIIDPDYTGTLKIAAFAKNFGGRSLSHMNCATTKGSNHEL